MDKIPLEQKELNSSVNPSHLSQLKLQQAVYSILPFCLSLGEDYFLFKFQETEITSLPAATITETVMVLVPFTQCPNVPHKTNSPDFSRIVSCKDSIWRLFLKLFLG